MGTASMKLALSCKTTSNFLYTGLDAETYKWNPQCYLTLTKSQTTLLM
jgi:hypothetical protein